MTVSLGIFLIVGLALVACGIIGGSLDGQALTGFAASLAQNRNLYLFVGILVLAIVGYRFVYHRCNTRQRHALSTVVRYVILIAVGILMVYPLLWMAGATFKDNV